LGADAFLLCDNLRLFTVLQDAPAFPSGRLLALLEAVQLPETEAKAWLTATQPLKQLALDYADGLEMHAQRIVVSLLQNYLAVEQLFQVPILTPPNPTGGDGIQRSLESDDR
jgi:hypothetical protein